MHVAITNAIKHLETIRQNMVNLEENKNTEHMGPHFGLALEALSGGVTIVFFNNQCSITHKTLYNMLFRWILEIDKFTLNNIE